MVTIKQDEKLKPIITLFIERFGTDDNKAFKQENVIVDSIIYDNYRNTLIYSYYEMFNGDLNRITTRATLGDMDMFYIKAQETIISI